MKKVKSLLLRVTVLVAQVVLVLVLVEAEEVTEVEGCASAASSALAHIVDKSFIQMLGTTDEQEEYYS